MKMRQTKKSLSSILCIVLIVAMALFTTGCNDNQDTASASETQAATEATQEATQETTQEVSDEVTVMGEGTTEFYFTVVDQEGNETRFEIHTDKETVGDALLELGLIEGEDGDYGLYVKTVNGITADYDKDGVYWAFYVNGEYAQAGVDMTTITEGESYSFQVE